MEDDDINAYDQAPPPDNNFYVHGDNNYWYWYRAKQRIEILSGFLLPVNRAFTGHPQARVLWVLLIVYLSS